MTFRITSTEPIKQDNFNVGEVYQLKTDPSLLVLVCDSSSIIKLSERDDLFSGIRLNGNNHFTKSAPEFKDSWVKNAFEKYYGTIEIKIEQ